MSDTPLTPLSEEQLSELEKLLVMITEGPWEFREDPKDNEDCGGIYPVNGDLAVMHFGNSEQYYPTAGTPPSESDLDFILAIRAYTSHLIAEVRRSRASSQADAVREAPDGLHAWIRALADKLSWDATEEYTEGARLRKRGDESSGAFHDGCGSALKFAASTLRAALTPSPARDNQLPKGNE